MNLAPYFPCWHEISPAWQQRLTQQAVQRRAAKGTVIHNGSVKCTGLLLMQSGQLRAYMLSPEGREVTLYRLFEGDVCLMSASCIMASVSFDIIIAAEKDTAYWLLPPDLYKQLMTQSAPIANYTNDIMALRFSQVMHTMEDILWKRFDQRLAAFLSEESRIEGSDSLHITHEAMGNHLGNPREVVTRMLRRFQSDGLIRLSRGCIKLLDKPALTALGKG